jgi:hypothetical protein
MPENQMKEEWLRTLPELFSRLSPENKGSWGKLNAWQMVEHMSDAVKWAFIQHNISYINPEEKWPALQQYIMSEKNFKENTSNPLMSEQPVPVRNSSFNDAISELQSALDSFFLFFRNNPNISTPNPIFGPLDYGLWLRLLEKHSKHHARQFNLIQ